MIGHNLDLRTGYCIKLALKTGAVHGTGALSICKTLCVRVTCLYNLLRAVQSLYAPCLQDAFYGKYVYVCGLDGDFRRKKFGQMLDLIPFCDEVDKLYSKCHICSGKAPFTKRITQEEGQVVIGSSNYVPLCRNCYDNYSVKK